MASHTTRDQIWSAAIKLTHRSGQPVTAEGIANSTGASKRTARDTLNTMVENFILERNEEGRNVKYVKGSWMDE